MISVTLETMEPPSTFHIHFSYLEIERVATAHKIPATPDATAKWVVSGISPEIENLPEKLLFTHVPYKEKFDTSPPEIPDGPHRGLIPILLQSISQYCELAYISPF